MRYRIEFQLMTPLVLGNHPIHLDDVLTYHVAIEQRGNLGQDAYLDEMIEIALPIQKINNRYYACSIGILQDHCAYDRAFYTKKWEGEIGGQFVVTDQVKFEADVHIGGGWSKAYQNELRVITTPQITFYVDGDLDELHRICKQVTHIGKKRSQGYGKVKQVLITETNQDSVWMEIDNQLIPIRNIPMDTLSDAELQAHKHRMAFTGFGSPYRDMKKYALCITPPIELWQPLEKKGKEEDREIESEEWIGMLE